MHEIEASGPEATFRRRMREARLARRLTQRDLVDALAEVGLDMNQTGITRIEGGARGITLHEAIAIAAALDIAPMHLFLPIDDTPVKLAPALEVDARKARRWARGELPLSPAGFQGYGAESAGEVPVSDEELSDDERAAVLAWREREARKLGFTQRELDEARRLLDELQTVQTINKKKEDQHARQHEETRKDLDRALGQHRPEKRDAPAEKQRRLHD